MARILSQPRTIIVWSELNSSDPYYVLTYISHGGCVRLCPLRIFANPKRNHNHTYLSERLTTPFLILE